MTNAMAGLLATANLTGYLLLSVVGGLLAARWGARPVVTGGLLTAGLGMVMTGLAPTPLAAAGWRLVTGLGSGAANVPVMGLVASWFHRRRGMAAGFAVAGSSLALIVVGFLIPRILAAGGPGGWRTCWVGYGVVTILLAALDAVVLREAPSPDGPSPPGTPHWGLVYRSLLVWHLGVVYLGFGFAYIIFMTFFTKRLVVEGGYTAGEAGTLFMLMGWLSLPCGPLWGFLSDSLGRRRTLVLIFAIQAVAYALFALAPPRPGYLLAAVVFGLTAWSIPAVMAAACGDIFGPRLAPAALGFVTLFMGTGQATSPWIAGLLADLLGNLGPAFLLAAAVSLMGALGSSFLSRLERHHPPPPGLP